MHAFMPYYYQTEKTHGRTFVTFWLMWYDLTRVFFLGRCQRHAVSETFSAKAALSQELFDGTLLEQQCHWGPCSYSCFFSRKDNSCLFLGPQMKMRFSIVDVPDLPDCWLHLRHICWLHWSSFPPSEWVLFEAEYIHLLKMGFDTFTQGIHLQMPPIWALRRFCFFGDKSSRNIVTLGTVWTERSWDLCSSECSSVDGVWHCITNSLSCVCIQNKWIHMNMETI